MEHLNYMEQLSTITKIMEQWNGTFKLHGTTINYTVSQKKFPLCLAKALQSGKLFWDTVYRKLKRGELLF